MRAKRRAWLASLGVMVLGLVVLTLATLDDARAGACRTNPGQRLVATVTLDAGPVTPRLLVR